MTYENPEVPHEVNVSRESALAEFLRLLAGIGIVVLAFAVLLYFTGAWLARRLPIELEQAWVGEHVLGIALQSSDAAEAAEVAAIETYLQRLANALAVHMPLPDGLRLHVHYTAHEQPNAFATLGGHIVVTSALIEQLPSENALAFVLAHEIAHLVARDPIAAVGGGLTIAAASTALSGDASALLAPLTMVVQRGYSREAESAADELAIAALQDHYGHAGGGTALFQVFASHREIAGHVLSDAQLPSLLATHPADAERIARISAASAGWDPRRQPLRAIVIPGSASHSN